MSLALQCKMRVATWDYIGQGDEMTFHVEPVLAEMSWRKRVAHGRRV
ncbi:MAG: hypothetical protein PVI98_04125 [Burkholderiales bacterium]|jgi:hypothetical protein